MFSKSELQTFGILLPPQPSPAQLGTCLCSASKTKPAEPAVLALLSAPLPHLGQPLSSAGGTETFRETFRGCLVPVLKAQEGAASAPGTEEGQHREGRRMKMGSESPSLGLRELPQAPPRVSGGFHRIFAPEGTSPALPQQFAANTLTNSSPSNSCKFFSLMHSSHRPSTDFGFSFLARAAEKPSAAPGVPGRPWGQNSREPVQSSTAQHPLSLSCPRISAPSPEGMKEILFPAALQLRRARQKRVRTM